MMRVVCGALLVMMVVLPGWGQDAAQSGHEKSFSLGLHTWVEHESSGNLVDLDLKTVWMQDRRPFDMASALDTDSAREYRVALWNSPLARTHYAMASEQAMLGREGLVHGGHMLGLGLATTALGDASHGGGINLLTDGRTTWAELSLGEKWQISLEASIAAGILYAIFD